MTLTARGYVSRITRYRFSSKSGYFGFDDCRGASKTSATNGSRFSEMAPCSGIRCVCPSVISSRRGSSPPRALSREADVFTAKASELRALIPFLLGGKPAGVGARDRNRRCLFRNNGAPRWPPPPLSSRCQDAAPPPRGTPAPDAQVRSQTSPTQYLAAEYCFPCEAALEAAD
jgi:hypothetical protein